ncbi:MAG: terminase small subunit [Sphingopyxis sp.]|nr:MAG: terminase small subunit [Sphingopyxis sp.]
MPKLYPKQKRFAEEYIKDLNGTEAAIRAGYSKRTAEQIAYQILQKPHVMEYIAKLQAERSKRTKIDADYVLQRLAEIDQMDFLDIMDDDMSLKAISQWPKVWRQYLSSFELAELFEGRGDDRKMIGVLKKIKWPDKVRNLELLGKHVSINAFRDQVDVNVNVSLADRMAKARERASSKT